MGGEQWVPKQKVFADSWFYEPATDRWSALPPLPILRHGLGAATLGKRVHLFGGGLRTGGNAATAVYEVLVVDARRPLRPTTHEAAWNACFRYSATCFATMSCTVASLMWRRPLPAPSSTPCGSGSAAPSLNSSDTCFVYEKMPQTAWQH